MATGQAIKRENLSLKERGNEKRKLRMGEAGRCAGR